jgi:hypothetical protein
MAGDKELTRKSYRKKREYYVDKNWILLKGFEGYDQEFIARKHEAQTPGLTLDRENDLVVRQTIKFTGAVMRVVPVGMSGREWGRFKRLR